MALVLDRNASRIRPAIPAVADLSRASEQQNVEGPEYCHEYTPGYDAMFFEDADGNKWEISCRNTRVR